MLTHSSERIFDPSRYTCIGLFLVNDMQTPPLRNGYIYMKDAQCTETNEKSIFRFLFFELWSILYSHF